MRETRSDTLPRFEGVELRARSKFIGSPPEDTCVSDGHAASLRAAAAALLAAAAVLLCRGSRATLMKFRPDRPALLDGLRSRSGGRLARWMEDTLTESRLLSPSSTSPSPLEGRLKRVGVAFPAETCEAGEKVPGIGVMVRGEITLSGRE